MTVSAWQRYREAKVSGHHKNHWRQSLACRMGSLFLAVLRELVSRCEDELCLAHQLEHLPRTKQNPELGIHAVQRHSRRTEACSCGLQSGAQTGTLQPSSRPWEPPPSPAHGGDCPGWRAWPGDPEARGLLFCVWAWGKVVHCTPGYLLEIQ